MDIKDEELNIKLCHTCLYVGRDTFEVTNEHIINYYNDVLDEVPLNKPKSFDNLMVCWECKAILMKCWRFREQIKDSYRILQSYTQENLHEYLCNSASVPPRLKTHYLEPIYVQAVSEDHSETPITYVKIETDKFQPIKDENAIRGHDNVLDNASFHVLEEESIASSFEKAGKEINRVTKCKSRRKTKSVIAIHEPKLYNDSSRLSVVEDKVKNCIPLSDQDECFEKPIHDVNLTGDWDYNKVENNDDDEILDKFDSETMDDNDDKQIDVDVESKISWIPKGDKKNKNRVVNNAKKIKNMKKKNVKLEREMTKVLTVELTYEEMLIERESESKRDSFLKAEYKCSSCLLGFIQKKSYQTHLNTKHSPDLGEYRCPICETIISSVDSFTAHYKRHMRRYECSICHKRTTDLKVMHQHYYSTHEISLKQYKCDVCGKVSNSIDTHRYHKDSHKARVECPDCDKTFRHRAGLMNHRLAVHELQNAFPCNVCDKVFRWKNSLKRHLEKHESKERISPASAYCTLCRIYFASICSYQRHMRNSLKHVTQDQLRYICDHCNRRFSDKTKLRDHIEEKHLHTTYNCHICAKAYKNRVGLDQHIRNVHKGRPKNKMCHHCGRGFPTKVQLESHIRTHTGERPFICEFCPTTFSQQSNLNKHYRQVHLNIKSKRYPITGVKKRKNDIEDICKVPTLQNSQVVDATYRPVVLQYSPDRPAEYIQYRNIVT